MANASAIEWTEATWNPATGCTKVSPGCRNCYAERLSKRLRAMGQPKYARGFRYTEHPGDVDIPLSWRKPRRIFVNSMSDLFHEDADMGFVGRCFDTMVEADWHTYQVLTKRPERMAAFSREFERRRGEGIPPHIWMGVSVEGAQYRHRIRALRGVRCATRFVSFEPLLGPIGSVSLRGIDWAIIGGESGPGFRPVREEWVDGLVELCRAHGTAVFFKQWGGIRPKSGGRKLHGKTYDEYPAAADPARQQDGPRRIPTAPARRARTPLRHHAYGMCNSQ